MSDRIILSDLGFFGRHGVLPEERVLGQRFVVDLEVGLDLRAAGQSDELSQSVSYADIFLVVREIVEGEPVKLIETVAQRIADAVFDRFTVVESVRVRVSKPSAPIAMERGLAAVEILRKRDAR